MRKVAKKVCKLSLFSQLSAPIKSGVTADVFQLFFFQAEDGIRDLVRSRGLGDVYKRQIPFFGRIRFADLTLKPRLIEHTRKLFGGDVAIRNSLRSNYKH